MLRSFRVENHKSIKGEAELLLMPAYERSRPVVPVVAIFGANASGKSNLLDALRWMQSAVRTSFGSWEPHAGIPRHPFRLDPSGLASPSLYAVELFIDDARHTYGFRVDDERVIEEWLYTYPHNRKRIIFERDGDTWTFGSTVPRAKVDLIADVTAPNVLFLSVAARTGFNDVAPIYQWFAESLRCVDSGAPFSARAVAVHLGRSDEPRTLVELLRAADLGIRSVHVDQAAWRPFQTRPEDQTAASSADREQVDLSADSKAALASFEAAVAAFVDHLKQPDLSFVHGANEVAMHAADQSRGTLAWLGLLVPALEALEAGGVLCVDEIDSSLHPRLSARLIELFRSAVTNPRHAQLIFTTHDATLLGTSFGEDILGRDEVWFVEKSDAGDTTLFPLSDFKPRKDENTERRYLGGSYGAVPDVSEDEFRRVVADRVDAA